MNEEVRLGRVSSEDQRLVEDAVLETIGWLDHHLQAETDEYTHQRTQLVMEMRK